MLITKEPKAQKKIQFRIRMNEAVYHEISAYCEWAGIKYRDYFIEQACQHIFTHDGEWKTYKKQQNK
ncbi:MAG: hypothetical protein CMF38_07570 [Legionellaceae bacterium]|nr:hypothetical protein [Legionellaceae bacterium]MBJ16471.1 hypothetical protein [Legionellaceae bacterium]HCA89778.1 hypothetical protein [Legionellales bacterium]|tara:strand:+ start:857 stop:1057 length:201 start_codon:yes stop_codon:yes gene_type:complete